MPIYSEWVESFEIHSRGHRSDASKYYNPFNNDSISHRNTLSNN